MKQPDKQDNKKQDNDDYEQLTTCPSLHSHLTLYGKRQNLIHTFR